MCGFLATYSRHGRRIEDSRMRQGLCAITHRGPDETGLWRSERGHVSLGHNRLSIIGLTNGLQPIASDDDTVHLLVNGEFYNFEEIRASLQASGCRFRTQSDSEIALHLYRMCGVSGLKRLRGEFSLVLYDSQNDILIAVRDRMGVKPLYYGEHDGTVYVGSEIKAILGAGMPAVWNRGAYATRAFYLADQTLFDGIASVQPGHMLIVSQGQIRQIPYWELEFPTQETLDAHAEGLNEAEVIADLREEILKAVKLRLRADVPIAFYLSGGVDSSAMLGAASHLNDAAFPAFHLSFDEDADYDEYRFAQEAAAFNGADFRPIQVRQADLADAFEDALWHNETPFFNAHGVAKFLLSGAVRDAGYKAVITGEGADEVFGGYPHFVRDMALYNAENQDPDRIAVMRDKIRSAAAKWGSGQRSPDLDWLETRLGHSVGWIQNQSGWFADLQRLYQPGMAAAFPATQPYFQMYNRLDYRKLEGRDPVNRSMYLWAKTFLPNFVLTTLGDRMEMAHSIEGRVPLLDHHLVEQAARLPVHYKIRGGREKYAFREAMRPFLPDGLYQRKKHYFRAPPATFFTDGPLYQLVQDTLSSRLLNDLPFFDAKAVRALIAKVPSMPAPEQARLDPMIMELVSLCLLQKRYNLSVPVSDQLTMV